MSKICKLFMMLLLVAACSEKDSREQLTISDSKGNTVVYKVELAQSKEELTTGLMNRTAMEPDSGMIFDLSAFNNVPTAMWMKDTKLALDMLFIDKDGMIFWIYENAEPESLKMIVSPYPAYAVLEVNAGDVAAKGIKIGDTVSYKIFKKETVEEAPVKAEDTADMTQPKDDATAADAAVSETEELPAEGAEVKSETPAENAVAEEEKSVEVEKEAAK